MWPPFNSASPTPRISHHEWQMIWKEYIHALPRHTHTWRHDYDIAYPTNIGNVQLGPRKILLLVLEYWIWFLWHVSVKSDCFKMLCGSLLPCAPPEPFHLRTYTNKARRWNMALSSGCALSYYWNANSIIIFDGGPNEFKQWFGWFVPADPELFSATSVGPAYLQRLSHSLRMHMRTYYSKSHPGHFSWSIVLSVMCNETMCSSYVLLSTSPTLFHSDVLT